MTRATVIELFAFCFQNYYLSRTLVLIYMLHIAYKMLVGQTYLYSYILFFLYLYTRAWKFGQFTVIYLKLVALLFILWLEIKLFAMLPMLFMLGDLLNLCTVFMQLLALNVQSSQYFLFGRYRSPCINCLSAYHFQPVEMIYLSC